MARNLLRNPWRIGWLLGVWLAMALSLGALSDCLADRQVPTLPLPTSTPIVVAPSSPPTPLPTATPVLTPSLFVGVCAGGPVSPPRGGSATVTIGQASIPPSERALVPISVTDVTNPRGLASYVMCITFDPAVVQVISVAGGEPPFSGVMAFHIANTEGWVSMVGVQGVTLNGPRGPITVAYLEVEAVGAWGTGTTLGLRVRDLTEPYKGDSMAATEVNGQVWVR